MSNIIYFAGKDFSMRRVPLTFYDRKDVVQIARELIGKILVTNIAGKTCSGKIVETEAYVGITDKASHSFAGKRTPRNEHMYAVAGTSYVYICYGMHHMMNIVTNKGGVPDAILIRAIEPVDGAAEMAARTGKDIHDKTITRGPGNVAKAMGIDKSHSGRLLSGNAVYLLESEEQIPDEMIAASNRIGVESAGADALLPYRFYLRGNPYVSGNIKNSGRK